MAQKTLAGTPNVRYPDPLVKRVNPNGTQPYTAYRAPLLYNNQQGGYSIDLAAPPGTLFVELLLFGADYPAKITGTQYYSGNPDEGNSVFDSAGSPIQIKDLTFTLPFSYGTIGTGTVVDILPNAPRVTYKQIATGKTLTNGVTVSGFPVASVVPSRDLYQTPGGSAGPAATYTVDYDVTLNGSVVDAPSNFGFFISDPPPFRSPVILWEPDLTQSIINNNYLIEIDYGGDGIINIVFDVVGLWSSPNYSPIAPGAGARSFAPPPPSFPSVPAAAADLIAAYAARVKNR